MGKIMNICIACDDNYSKYAGVVIASILANAKEEENLHFYILDGGIAEKNKNDIYSLKELKACEISFITIDEKIFEDYKAIKTHQYITLPAYYRLKLPTLLPNVDKILYLDCDVIVNSGLSEIFEIDIDEYAVAGVKDINKRMLRKNPNYVNSGVLMLNLALWKKENIEEKILDFTRKNSAIIKTGDQEIINECLKGQILILDDEWNVQSSNFTNRSSYTHNPKIIHFVAKKKPWHFASFSFHRNLYFKYLQLTPWKLNPQEYKHWTVDNQLASLIKYVQYRPLFLLRPQFYKALFYTYILHH